MSHAHVHVHVLPLTVRSIIVQHSRQWPVRPLPEPPQCVGPHTHTHTVAARPPQRRTHAPDTHKQLDAVGHEGDRFQVTKRVLARRAPACADKTRDGGDGDGGGNDWDNAAGERAPGARDPACRVSPDHLIS